MEDRPLEKILPLLESIEEIAHDREIAFDDAKHILDNKKMSNDLKIIRKFYLEVALKLEKENAMEILESDDPWSTLKSFYFYERYEKLIKNENHLANFSSDDSVAFIGGGPLPLTLILFNRVLGLMGISVEIDPAMAALSRDVLKKLELDSQIQVVCGNETVIFDMDFDVLMVAALAEPKERVFKNIKNMVTDKTRIIYRTYTGMRTILHAPVTEKAIYGFEMVNMIFPEGKVNNTSVLIRKP
jgi:hypothetical protein